MPRVEQATDQPTRDPGAARVAESVRRALLLVGPAEGTSESAAREANMTGAADR